MEGSVQKKEEKKKEVSATGRNVSGNTLQRNDLYSFKGKCAFRDVVLKGLCVTRV